MPPILSGKADSSSDALFIDLESVNEGFPEQIQSRGGSMNRVLLLFATLAVFESIPGSQAAPPAESRDEASLRATMKQCRRAQLEGDVEQASACLTEDYHQTDISGYVQDKQRWLDEYFKPLAELIRAGKFHWQTFDRTDVQIRMHGDCAIVIGALRLKGIGARFGPNHTWLPDPNAAFEGTLRFTHVYVWENGKWRLTALHNQMPPPAPAK